MARKARYRIETPSPARAKALRKIRALHAERAQLQFEWRKAIVFALSEGCSTREVADAASVSMQAIYQLVERAAGKPKQRKSKTIISTESKLSGDPMSHEEKVSEEVTDDRPVSGPAGEAVDLRGVEREE